MEPDELQLLICGYGEVGNKELRLVRPSPVRIHRTSGVVGCALRIPEKDMPKEEN